MSVELLRVSNLQKSFNGRTVLRDLSFAVREGEICGVIGPNGSGKTVLFDLISGFHRPDRGSICWVPSTLELATRPPHVRHGLGITRTFQNLRLFAGLTVLDNALVGLGTATLAESVWEMVSGRRGRRKEEVRRENANRVLAIFESRLLPNAGIDGLSLSYANRRRLEFARALAGKPQLVLLDEPTAGMNPSETFEMQRIIYRLKQEGITFLIIEHKMFFLEDLADRALVLAQGQKIAEGTIPEIRKNAAVRSAYLGEPHAS